MIAAIASTPPILSGGGGIDLSVGPLLGFVNVILVVRLIPERLRRARTSPCPLLLLLGAGVGLINGVLVAVVRLQPIVATLGMYLILVGWQPARDARAHRRGARLAGRLPRLLRAGARARCS